MIKNIYKFKFFEIKSRRSRVLELGCDNLIKNNISKLLMNESHQCNFCVQLCLDKFCHSPTTTTTKRLKKPQMKKVRKPTILQNKRYRSIKVNMINFLWPTTTQKIAQLEKWRDRAKIGSKWPEKAKNKKFENQKSYKTRLNKLWLSKATLDLSALNSIWFE